jgi:hypothetical protein
MIHKPDCSIGKEKKKGTYPKENPGKRPVKKTQKG